MRKNRCGYCQFFVCDKKLAEPTCYLQHRFVYEGVKGAILTGFRIDHYNNCSKRKYYKSATSKQDKQKYRFEFVK